MGTCRSSCSPSTELEYYDVWRKDQPIRGARRHPTFVVDRAPKSLETKTLRPAHRHTKLWVCDRGCCSIRWKLDYAEFQSYSKYAEISPYVVVQENNQDCTCVICNGLPEQFLQCRLDQIHTRMRTATASPSETDDEDTLDAGDRGQLIAGISTAKPSTIDGLRSPVSSPVA